MRLECFVGLKRNKYLTVRGFQECLIPKQVLGWGSLAFPISPSLQKFREPEQGRKPKFRTTVRRLLIFSPPFSKVLKPQVQCVQWYSLPSLCHIRYYLLAFSTHILVPSRFLRICLWICKAQYQSHTRHDICFSWGQLHETLIRFPSHY